MKGLLCQEEREDDDTDKTSGRGKVLDEGRRPPPLLNVALAQMTSESSKRSVEVGKSSSSCWANTHWMQVSSTFYIL